MLTGENLKKMGSTLMKRSCSCGSKFLSTRANSCPQELAHPEKVSKNENGRGAISKMYPENVPVYLQKCTVKT